MTFRLSLPIALVLCLLTVGGCDLKSPLANPASLTYTEDAHAAYRQAMAAFNDERWEDGRSLFSELRRLFAYSRYARLAALRLADIDFEQQKFSEAMTGYRNFIRGHATDENVEYARYRIAKALYLDNNVTVLLPPQEERDQANTRDAYRELKRFNERFPKSRYRIDTGYMLEVVAQRLVRHELYVARYHLLSDNFDAALRRCDDALKKYPGSGLDAEALVLKGETLLKAKRNDEARVVFEAVIRDHKGSFSVVAKRFLKHMGTDVRAGS